MNVFYIGKWKQSVDINTNTSNLKAAECVFLTAFVAAKITSMFIEAI